MNREEILKQVEEDEIDFISLQFTDLLGVVKEVIIPVSQLEEAIEYGIWFDGSSVEGFARIQESDLFLKPDLSTYGIVPWLRENGRTARFICDIYGRDGQPFEGDPRHVLRRAMQEAEEMGYMFNVGPEPEFYIFRRSPEGNPLPLDVGSYFDFASHEGYRVLREILDALKNFNIPVEASHHEVGKGQFEIDFKYSNGLETADRILTLKYTVKKIAQRHGLEATFMPKPIFGAPGNGMHTHQSLFDIKRKRNAFYDDRDPYNLSRVAYHYIAGIMSHVKAMCAVICPTVNSYKRLISGFEAPVYITWARINRSALIRVPQWFRGREQSARIELRCPDPTSNPYLALAFMLAAGLDGIRNRLEPPEPVEENVYQLDEERILKEKIDVLPGSLAEAIEEFKKDPLSEKVLGEHLYRRYLDIKTKEWNAFKTQVTRWELDQYFEMY